MDDEPASPGQLLMRHALRLGSGLFGCAELLDLGREALSGGAWHATPGLGQVYGVVLSGYALTREWDKWDGTEPDLPRNGHLFLYAWALFPVLVWLPQLMNYEVAWPASLNGTLAWVIGAYAGTKVSRGLRGLTRARAARAAPEPETPDHYWARHALRFGSMLLGAVCWLDAAIEGFTTGEWHFVGSIYAAYYLVLGAYASTREWEKWTDRYDQDAYWGHLFVWAWFLLMAALWAARYLGYMVVIPSNLYPTVATVLGIYVGGKASQRQRLKAGASWWGYPAPPAPERPPRRGSPSEGGGQAPGGSGLPEKRGPSRKEQKAAQHAADRAKIVAYIQNRGAFRPEEAAEATSIPVHAVRVHVTHLVRDGQVRDLGGGRFIWIGKGGKTAY